MSISKEFLDEMNRIYYELDMKRVQLWRSLFHQSLFDVDSGWYNGHQRQDENGDWYREACPIPAITAEGIAYIEIQFDKVTVSAKLKRSYALSYSYEKLRKYSFKAYGADDWASIFYRRGQTIQDLKKNIAESDETEVFFSFSFPFDVAGDDIYEFVKLLRRERFYY